MVMTRLKNGGGIWKIQYSNDGASFKDCGELDKMNGQNEVAWPSSVGSFRYWRYFMEKNSTNPWYYGYEWFYLV